MAAVVTLHWLNNTYIDGVDIIGIRGSLPLLSGDPHFHYGWHIEKWVPAAAQPDVSGDVDLVTEKIICLVNAADKDDLSAEFVALDKMAEIARQGARDTSTCSSVFIRATPNNGRNLDAYVHNINYELLEPITDACGYIEKNQLRVRLEILREPYWEETSIDSTTASPTAAASVMIDYREAATDIPGGAGTRMTNLKFYPAAVGDEVGRLWVGLRTDRHNVTPANFVNIWELEDGTLNDTPPSGDSGITVDNTTDVNGASPGSGSGEFVKLIPTDLTWDDTWHEVLSIEIGDTSPIRTRDQFGLSKWLLRAMVTAGEWQVRLKFGYSAMDDDDFAENGIADVDNTNWDYYDMGQRQVPFRDARTIFWHPIFEPTGSEAEEFTIQVWARRTSGAGNLYLDCLCPIPLDEGYFITSNCGATKGAIDTDIVAYMESAYRTADCLIYIGSGGNAGVKKSVEFNANDFNFAPNCEGLMVIVYARDDYSDLTDVLAYNGHYTKRWLSIREAE